MEIAVMALKRFDLVVIGGGPGGYVGAIRAAQMGLKVACVERDKLGGVCLNWGCIPTKALLHNAELYREAITHGAEWGFQFKPTDVSVDWSKVVGRSRNITGTLNSGIAYLFKKNKIEHIVGHAKILSSKVGNEPCKILVGKATGAYYGGSGDGAGETIEADRILISTGAQPVQLPFAPNDGKVVISSYEAMNLPKKPASMVIIGSGAIGMEFAYFYNSFGTKVTVIEMQDRILPVEDDDICAAAQKSFEKQGIQFLTGHKAASVDKGASGAKVTVESVKDASKKVLECEVVLVAAGVRARVEGLCDASLGLKMWDAGPARGHIWTDYTEKSEPTYQTSLPGVYAIGDVIGPPWLAHVASEEAVACVERFMGHHTLGVDYASIPGATYCNPQVASVGMTERDVKAKGLSYTVGKYPLKAHGKAIAVGATEGLVKLIASKPYGEILGAHIFGEDASELIHEICIAKRLEATIEDIISTVHAHPTMAESIHEAALASEGRVIHG